MFGSLRQSVGKYENFYYIFYMAKMITSTEHKQIIHQIVYRLSQLGIPQCDIAFATDYTQGNVSHILHKIDSQEGLEHYEVSHSPGRPTALNAGQAQLLSEQLKRGAKAAGFSSEGWTRRRVHDFIKARFKVDYSMPHISRLMVKLGYSLQQPQVVDPRRSSEQEKYYEQVVLPELKKKLMHADQHLIYVDEASFCSAGSSSKVYGLTGQTPVMRQANSVTERVYAISGVTPRGELFSHVRRSAFNSEAVAGFLHQLLSGLDGQLNVIWDNASIHCSQQIRSFLRTDEQARRRLTLYSTPVYCPWYNPDEQVWNYLKAEYMPHRWCRTKTQLVNMVSKGLDSLAKLPHRIRKAFRHPDVKLMEY